MQSMDRPDPDACEKVDELFGMLPMLDSATAQPIRDHLAMCPACMVAYLELVTDAQPEAIASPPWKGPTMDDIPEPHMIRTRTALLGGAAFAAVAVFLALLMQRVESPEEVAAVPVAPAAQPAPAASRPIVVAPTPKATPIPLTPLEQLAADVEEALTEGRVMDALGYCQEAISLDAPPDDAAYVCGLAYCASGNIEMSKRVLSGIAAQATLEKANGVCDADAQNAACDEVTCLVDPGKACCAGLGEGDDGISDRERLANEITSSLDAKSNSLARDLKYVEALERCELALRINPKDSDARMSCAVSACNLKDAVVARRHIDAIDGATRAMAVRQICIRNGLEL